MLFPSAFLLLPSIVYDKFCSPFLLCEFLPFIANKTFQFFRSLRWKRGISQLIAAACHRSRPLPAIYKRFLCLAATDCVAGLAFLSGLGSRTGAKKLSLNGSSAQKHFSSEFYLRLRLSRRLATKTTNDSFELASVRIHSIKSIAPRLRLQVRIAAPLRIAANSYIMRTVSCFYLQSPKIASLPLALSTARESG